MKRLWLEMKAIGAQDAGFEGQVLGRPASCREAALPFATAIDASFP